MPSYVTRLGKEVEADEVFHACASGDLARMTRALTIRTNPIDRHFLLLGIVQLSYKRRAEPEYRQLCLDTARLHMREFDDIAPYLRKEMGGFMPRVPTFQLLTILLTKDGELAEAVRVCEYAIRWGVRDGTKRGFQVRLERLRKKLRDIT
jgi:hypothetical protein